MSGGMATRVIRVTEEQYRFLASLKRSPYEPMHVVLDRVLKCYQRCKEWCEQRELADFDVV